MPHHPVRTLNIYDKGSNYLILDNDDTTPLYNAHFTPNSTPHMTVTRPDDPKHTVGTATFFPTQKLHFATASNIELTLPQGRTVSMNKHGGLISSDKRAVQTVQGLLYWKGGYAETGFLKLVDEHGAIVCEFKNQEYTMKKMGVFEIMHEVGGEMLDDIVVSGVAMISEEKTSMSQVAGQMAAAGSI